MITVDDLKRALPDADEGNIEHFGPALIAGLKEFEITDLHHIACLLSQVTVESQRMSRVVENLNYRASGLLRVFPKYFTPDLVAQYEKQPQKIANRVYANRMGNGSEASGDGFRFRGRGLPQITGKDNYRAFGEAIGLDLLSNPEYLETAEGAARAACWFFAEHGVSEYADARDFDGVCDCWNRGHKTAREGDAIGYQERLEAYLVICSALGV